MNRIIVVLSLIVFGSVCAIGNENGAKVYSSCVSCHGEKGLGIQEKSAPKLASQHSWYLELQLNAFKSGSRAYKNSATCAQGLSASQISDVSNFLSSL